MRVPPFQLEVSKRRTFAIISHPDAGKTTITEKLLLLGNAIQVAGAVKSKRNTRKATSDWMRLEQERGISITTAVMQFPYQQYIVNLLDTPGHEDFSEDTYRTLSAVDSVLMIIDGTKGVEARTIKLMKICRLRNTPIFTFINKIDCEMRDNIELLDEIESVLDIDAAPINWPLGMGKSLKGLYNLYTDTVHVYQPGFKNTLRENVSFKGLNSQQFNDLMDCDADMSREQIELVHGASHPFNQEAYLLGKQTPVYFGTALANFGVCEWLNDFVLQAPKPQKRETNIDTVDPMDTQFSGFVFKIQANMDPKHRDRIAFLRICSGHYQKGIKLHQQRLQKAVKINDALTFMAGERTQVDSAVAGDIIGLHNHGTIQIGDTFSSKAGIKFIGIPNFAPELFRIITLGDPLRIKQLRNGLKQLSEEGSVQVFFPIQRNHIIVGAVGVLQFEVVAFRMRDEYKVNATYESAGIYTARWIETEDPQAIEILKSRAGVNLAVDGGGCLTYLAPSRANLQLTKERHPNICFTATREH